MRKLIVVALLGLTVLVGCGSNGTTETANVEKTVSATVEESTVQKDGVVQSAVQEEQEGENMPTENVEKTKDENQMLPYWNRVADMVDEVYKEKNGENTIVSPLSLNFALGLASEGAEGETKKELEEYLNSTQYNEFSKGYLEYEAANQKQLEERYGDEKIPTLKIANSVWASDQVKLKESYVKQVENYYDAVAQQVSFSGTEASNTVKKINGWCAEKTENMIPEIIQANDVNEDTAAVLVNTIYFDSPWVSAFDSANDGDFTTIDGKTIQREMLKGSARAYFENGKAIAFSKPYQQGLEFIGILPKQEGEFTFSDLDVKSLLDSRTEEYKVKVNMPSLDFETSSNNLIPMLSAMGVKQCFSPEQADFSGMFEAKEGENPFISKVVQKCVIELNKEGTKASAATAAVMMKNAAFMDDNLKMVNLDRPFAFMIYDAENQQVVFAGKVVK